MAGHDLGDAADYFLGDRGSLFGARWLDPYESRIAKITVGSEYAVG